ncbi:MAG: FapA family protein [Pseudomonadota bacterium]
MRISGDETLFQAAIAASGTFIAVITAERRILSAGGKGADAAIADMTGKYCFEVFYGRAERCGNCGLEKAMACGGPVLIQRSETTETGETVAYNHIYPVAADAGTDAWVCAAITAQTPVVKKSDLSIAFLSKLIQSAVDGVIAADKQGRIRIYNEAAASLLGYSVKEALAGLDIRKLYPENVAFDIMNQLRSDRFGGKGKLDAYRVFVLHKSGERIPVRLNASIIVEDGREIATVGFFRDLREELQLRSALVNQRLDSATPEGEASLAEIREGFTLQMAAYDSKFSAVAAANGMVTGEQVDRALLKQQEIIEKTKIHIPIGRVMIQMGIITEMQREALLTAQKVIPAPGVPAARKDSAIPEGADSPEAAAPYFIRVSDDGLEAILEVEPEARGTVATEAVMAALAEMGIEPLETAQADIAAYLGDENAPTAALVVARGSAPVAGTPSEIRFHFETDPLRAGTERDDGTIDWKDRGSIPQVTAGDTLATISPAVQGIPGKDVYGNPVPAPIPPDRLPACGKGAALSEDGMTFSAVRQGMAQISADNVLDVLETLAIAGDVGLDTGHVDFAGHIEVAGAIQEGYRVSGGSMRVTDINGAEVTLTGDLVVTGGIYGAVVKCGGSVKASHIHKSRVNTGKDLTVGREIIDSQVETNGKCVTSSGTIISSEISAKMGIVSGDVGTDAAKPSLLQVGVDLRLQRQIQNVRNKIRLLNKEKTKVSTAWQSLSAQSERISDELGEKAQQQDKCMVQIRELTAERDALPLTGEKARRKMLEKHLQMAERKKENLDAQVENLMEKDESLSRDVSRMSADVAGLAQDMDRVNEELAGLTAAAHTGGGIPSVKASGKIAAGTTISGPNAVLITTEVLSRVLVLETDKPDAEGVRKWHMSTQPLR